MKVRRQYSAFLVLLITQPPSDHVEKRQWVAWVHRPLYHRSPMLLNCPIRPGRILRPEPMLWRCFSRGSGKANVGQHFPTFSDAMQAAQASMGHLTSKRCLPWLATQCGHSAKSAHWCSDAGKGNEWLYWISWNGSAAGRTRLHASWKSASTATPNRYLTLWSC